eukprot:scaffold43903_cov40-Prasinocladus_malaysianus.AAC.1
MGIKDGELYAMLPGVHAFRTHRCQFKPYTITQDTIAFNEGSRIMKARQEFDGGIVLTLKPSEVGFAYNVPGGCSSAEMGQGVILIPPGTWVIRSPIIVARVAFEATTAARNGSDGAATYIQEISVGAEDMAKPRLVYVPYNHSAMFIDGNKSQICDQGFHWASPGIEIAGPWPQHEQRHTFEIESKTLDNMIIHLEAEVWVQMVNPELYVKVAGKEISPKEFVGAKLQAKVKQHVAGINALQMRAVEHGPETHIEPQGDDGFQWMGDSGSSQQPSVGVPVTDPTNQQQPNQSQAGNPADPFDIENVMETMAEESPTESQVFNRIKGLLDEVRGFVDGRESSAAHLASQVQHAINRSGLALISLAALTVNLPDEITAQIQQANEEQIIAQTEQATNHAKAQKHIAAKYAEIRKKKADREEETKDAENQVTLQKTKARLAEAEEFAKRQAKRAEQKVEQSLELQALEHRMVREQARIDNDLRILGKEEELIAKQAEIEERRLALVKKQQEREKLEADIEAYKVSTQARANREKVNQQTLVDSIMMNLGKPMEGSRILTINGSAFGDDSAGNNGSMGMLPQMIAMKEILGQTSDMQMSGRISL